MKLKDTILSSLLIATGIILPVIFHTAGLGTNFLPMHLPVLMAGLILGPKYGLITGAMTPALSSLLTGMPPFPIVIPMIMELSVYGFLNGYLQRKTHITITFVISIIISRITYVSVFYLFLPFFGVKSIPFWYSLTGGIIATIPGIICQCALLPVIMVLKKRLDKREMNN